ncbi:phospholipase D-like domain-containing protein [Pelagicoccus sp. SDUM812003]|nr:phospholipase D-like domain-containing protein [Pelagicoccus sp. SDUM812003]
MKTVEETEIKHGAPKSEFHQLRYLEHTIGAPFTDGNHISVLKNGDQIFPAMLEAIENARRSILFETYVYWTGDVAKEFSELLAAKAKQGLQVKVLLDDHGASRMSSDLVETMTQSGVHLHWFRPMKLRFWDYDKRTHRKVLVCDNQVGFTGGVGIAKEWEGDARDASQWRETHFRIEGPAVAGLCGAFWNNWIDISGERLPDRDTFPPAEPVGQTRVQVIRSSPATHQSEMELVFESLIVVAKKKLTITTPYFNIRSPNIELLKKKAAQGVSIEILLPGEHLDKRFEYFVADECLGPLADVEGITLRRYQRSMIHAKVIRVDDAISCVGSPNFNQRSRKKDFEIALVIFDREIAGTLDQHYQEDLLLSEPINPQDLHSPHMGKKLFQKLIMLFKEQL